MITKEKIHDYNWPDLYKQAEDFLHQYIQEAVVHTGERTLFDSRPAVTIHFQAIGHKQELDILQKKACYHRFRGATVNRVRMVYANIYFTADGSRIYGEEEETLK